ncbi:MAG: enoyl-CoA hydratase-related protein [Acidimicrobiales bacterium]
MTNDRNDTTLDTFTSDVLTLEADGPIATLWLDRPEKRNALGPAFWADLPRAMAALGASRHVRAIVLAAKGPHFSVGLDLTAFGTIGGEPAGDGAEAGGGGGGGGGDRGGHRGPSAAAQARRTRADVLRLQASVSSISECPIPVIAAIHGYCIGGGVDLASACDIRLASADAVLSVREAKVAMVADLGSLQRLPAIIGRGHLAELAYTGKDISAARAAEIGLVNHVYDDVPTLLTEARALAAEIAANSPLAVQGTKIVLDACAHRSVAEGLDYVATWNAGFIRSADLTEAMTAFMEKRPAHFTGE